jgi:hypothetical protein
MARITTSSYITQAAKWKVEGNSKSASNSASKQIKVNNSMYITS